MAARTLSSRYDENDDNPSTFAPSAATQSNFAGCDSAVRSAIVKLDARFMRSRWFGGAWLVHQADADDVMALLEHRGYWLEVTL